VLLSKASEKMVAQFNRSKPSRSKWGATPNAICQVPKPPSRLWPNRSLAEYLLDIMSDTLISAIVMAVISSLAFIAYKHSKEYERMYWPLTVIVLVIMLFDLAYSIGYDNGFSDSSVHHPKNHDLFPSWVWLGLTIFVVYLGFLLMLPHILNLPTKNTKKDEPESKVSEKGSDDDV
jgi:hypothetical protein